MAKSTDPYGLTPLDFARKFIRVPDLKTKQIIPIPLHDEQVKVLRVLGEKTPDGLRRIRELLAHWFRQAGKTTILAIKVLWGLVCDPWHTDRLVTIGASDEEQGLRVFLAAKRMAARHPWLAKHITWYTKHAIYVSVDAQGHRSEHRIQVLAAGDIRGAAGMAPTLAIFDEVWTQETYDLIEPLTESPARLCPLTIYASYSGLRSQQRAGVPLTDLIVRGRAGDDPQLHYSYLGKAQWSLVPWVTPEWIARVRKQLGSVPARFARLIENRVAASDDAFITDEELNAAMVPGLTEPSSGQPGDLHTGGADLGLVRAWTAVTIGHVNADGVFLVDVLRHWKGSPGRPVSLDEVEGEIVALASRFPLSEGPRPGHPGDGGFRIDPWQGQLLGERLEQKHIPVVLLPITSQRVDQLVTRLKSLFAQRLIRFSADLIELREQLEGLSVVEGKGSLLRFKPDGSVGAARFTDLVFSLALAVEAAEGAIGRSTLPEMEHGVCNRAASVPGGLPACYLWNEAGGSYIPMGCPACANCKPHQYVQARHQQDSKGYFLRDFRWQVIRGHNTFTERQHSTTRTHEDYLAQRRVEEGLGM
jgi:hypothetical protein